MSRDTHMIYVIVHENRLRVSGQLKNTSVNKALDLVRKFIKMRFTDGKELTLEVPLKSRIVFEGVAQDC